MSGELGYPRTQGGARSAYRGAHRGYGPASGLDFGDFAVYPLILGFTVVYLNLDEVVAQGLGNQSEKALLILAAILFLISRPLPPSRLYLTLAFAAAPAIALIGTDFLYASTGRFVRGFVSYMSPWLLMAFWVREREARLLMIALSFAPLFCVGIGFVYETVGLWELFHKSYDGAVRLQGSTIPAFLAAGAALGVFACMVCARHYDQRYFLLAVVNLAILALTGGRMALVIALLGAGFYVLARYRITVALVMQGVAAVAVMVVSAFALFPDLIARLSESGDSGRGDLWAVVWRVWEAHPYFGIGLGHQGMIVPESVSKWVTTTAAHNEYLRLGCELGWVGLTLLGIVLTLFILVNTLLAPKKGDPMFALMCLLFLLFSYSDNALSLPTMFGLMVAALYERSIGVGQPARIPFNPFRRRPPAGWGPLA